jgi:uncharacterized protein YqgV (UPF0045/DUF77 family)
MNKRFLTALLTGAFFLASTSMFVACKDYDDDIKNLQTQIDKAALQSDLQSLKTTLEGELTTLKAALAAAQTELAKKANQADVDAALATKADKTALEALADKVAKLTERVSTIETQITAINEALDKKADKTELAALEAALTGKLDNLEKAINDEKGAREAADTKLEAAIKAVEANLELQKKALAEAKAALEAKDAELQGLISANTTAIEALNTKMSAAEANIKKLQEETIPALEKKLQDQITANATDIAELKTLMNNASKSIDALASDVNVLNVLVNKRLTSLVFDPQFYWGGIESTEAAIVRYNAMSYTKKYDATKPYSQNDAGGQLIIAEVGNKTTNNNLPVLADYYMNPSSASIDYITGMSVVSGDKEYYTRAAASAPAVESYSAKDGILTAQITGDWSKLAADELAEGAGKVTVFAVQATVKGEENDTTVTSDFAAIAPSIISNFVIADNDPIAVYNEPACGVRGNTKTSHVYITEETAIANPYTHELIWNDENGIDLDEIVEVHANRALNIANAAAATEFKLEDLMERYGFKLQYKLISWLSGTNKTEETLAHATLDGSILKASGINGEQTKASIGRQPLVLIELIDTKNNNALVKIGYIKFCIVAEKGKDVTINPPYSLNAYLTCADQEISLKWDDVEGDILANTEVAATGISKATFESVYALHHQYDATYRLSELNPNAPYFAKTYVPNGDGWKVATDNNLQGIIYYLRADGQEHQTNVLAAEFTHDQILNILVKRNKQGQPLNVAGQPEDDQTKWDLEDSKSILIACRLYDAALSGYPDIYVPFQLTVSKLQVSLNKIPEYWYAENSAEAQSGFDEIHVNVDVVGQPNATVEHFQGDFLATVFKNELSLALKAADDNTVGKKYGYKAAEGYPISDALREQIADDFTSRLHFKAGTTKIGDYTGTVMTGLSGAKYLVLPNAADNQTLEAYKLNAAGNAIEGDAQTIVTIEDDTNFVVYDDDNDDETSYLEDLLNYASHKDLANTLTATVGISVTLDDCDAPVLLTDSTFNVKFLRPVDVDGSASKEFTDAVDGGNKLDIIDLIKPIDWRDKWDGLKNDGTWNYVAGTGDNANKFYVNSTYFNYYEVKSIEPDIDGITTNMGGGTLGQTLLSDVSNQVEVNYYDGGATHLVGAKNDADALDFGYLLYTNNNNTVTEFTIRVPLTIGYHWGQTQSYVDIKVKNTLNN